MPCVLFVCLFLLFLFLLFFLFMLLVGVVWIRSIIHSYALLFDIGSSYDKLVCFFRNPLPCNCYCILLLLNCFARWQINMMIYDEPVFLQPVCNRRSVNDDDMVGRLSTSRLKCRSWPIATSTALIERFRISRDSSPLSRSASRKPRRPSGLERWRSIHCGELHCWNFAVEHCSVYILVDRLGWF